MTYQKILENVNGRIGGIFRVKENGTSTRGRLYAGSLMHHEVHGVTLRKDGMIVSLPAAALNKSGKIRVAFAKRLKEMTLEAVEWMAARGAVITYDADAAKAMAA